ncbi:hypothetical protein D1007_47875 [Hordeum vulgare]|uniref:DUF547 domain-containing protein n=1 Tax=Hordeum vulgare subsp. vulgare TaxID=112509 RepID=A0A8I7BG18_HORVV|nr:uncharacterized protein LOC123399685 [Hordeum vulgare subsp. vulgare]KAE8779148.1 hypothetical protein D1007_47875 [Hordeum vulgare]
MEYVAVARSLTPMSRRTRHAHHLQLVADPPLQAPPPPLPPPLQPTTAGIGVGNGNGNGNGVQVQRQQQQQSQRRMDLEQEVSELKQQLSNEQTVHNILERALHAPANSSTSARSVLLNIPAFIPSKAKQLLAELVLVEEEIVRLESQIHTMKGSLTVSQQQRASVSMASSTYSYPASVYTNNNGNPLSVYTNNGTGSGNASNGGEAATRGNGTTSHSAPASARHGNNNVNGEATVGNGTPTHTAPTLARQASDQAAPEIKSMFFISQAMNAEYLQRHLAATAAADDKPAKSPREQARGSSGSATAVSPKLNGNIFGLPPRNSLEKQSDRAPEKPPRVSQQASPPTTMTKRDEQAKVQPNKLSERIVKCLAVIFIRLLRSSRVAEMEKSGNLARSGNLQGSFRIDATLNVAAAKEKDQRGQQDHYGIFGVPDSVVRDIGPYKNLVRFTSSAFDLRGFSSSPLLTKLREMLEALQQVDLRFLTHQQKLAFWLNIYNTCIMHGILQHGLPSNSEKLLALKNKATINVSGQKFNALVIENFVLRQPSSVKEEFWKCDVDVEEQRVRGLYGLNSSEPNILFAMCCGTRSSPALRIYKADRVMMDLEKAKLDYLQASLVVTSTRRLMIPGLIHSNMHDFSKDMESLLRWICDQLPTSWSLRKSMVDCLRGHQGHLKVEDVVEVIPYDYEFQYLLPM